LACIETGTVANNLNRHCTKILRSTNSSWPCHGGCAIDA